MRKVKWQDFSGGISDAERGNNVHNLRNYGQKWRGEVSTGVPRGGFLGFDSKANGFRAGTRNVRGILGRLDQKTIRGLVPVFSPASENDVDRHMRNISALSGIGIDQNIDVEDQDTMFRLMTSLAMAESGRKALSGLSQADILGALESAKKSL